MSRPAARALAAALRPARVPKPSRRQLLERRILTTVDRLEGVQTLLRAHLDGAPSIEQPDLRRALALADEALKGCPRPDRYFRSNDPTWQQDYGEDVVAWFRNNEENP